jgi:hypothetical protein
VHKFTEQLEILALLETELVHIRSTRKKFSYEAKDEPVQSPKKTFKANFYFAVLDTAIQSVQERFKQIHQISFV